MKSQKIKKKHERDERNKENNYPLILHRKYNTETDIKWNLSYSTAPGIEHKMREKERERLIERQRKIQSLN